MNRDDTGKDLQLPRNSDNDLIQVKSVMDYLLRTNFFNFLQLLIKLEHKIFMNKNNNYSRFVN